MSRHRYSRNARLDTPLAIEYRRAKKAYHDAGRALRNSCKSKKQQACGFPRAASGSVKQYKFFAENAAKMEADFLAAPAPSGTNESILLAQLGHLTVKDPAQWESVAEKYETGPLETFSDAFAALAKVAKGSKRKPDWRKFDIEVLRSCPGLGDLQMPEWMMDASNQQEEAARYYGRYSEEVPF
jgi:hypothetical protein